MDIRSGYHGALLASAGGLLIGIVFDPRKITLVFSVIVPITFLGCVYYPWASLSPIPWLKSEPVVYMTERCARH